MGVFMTRQIETQPKKFGNRESVTTVWFRPDIMEIWVDQTDRNNPLIFIDEHYNDIHNGKLLKFYLNTHPSEEDIMRLIKNLDNEEIFDKISDGYDEVYTGSNFEGKLTQYAEKVWKYVIEEFENLLDYYELWNVNDYFQFDYLDASTMIKNIFGMIGESTREKMRNWVYAQQNGDHIIFEKKSLEEFCDYWEEKILDEFCDYCKSKLTKEEEYEILQNPK